MTKLDMLSGRELDLPLPLAGEVAALEERGGWGLSPHEQRESRRHPHPSPPPQAGEGAQLIRR
jgi:iron complex transport system substrate-binding protein